MLREFQSWGLQSSLLGPLCKEAQARLLEDE